MMFKRILVLLDGPACAEQALPLAARIAHASGGSVQVDDLAEGSLCSGPEALTNFERAKGLRADLILVASNGAPHIKRWLQGSAAPMVARTSPVLVLHAKRSLPSRLSAEEAHPFHPFSAAVALDGFRQAESAIEPAAQLVAALAAPAHGSLHLTRVVQRPGIDDLLSGRARRDSLHREQAVNEATDYVSGVVETLQISLAMELNLAISWSISIDSDVANGLSKVAEQGIADGGTCPLGGCHILALATHSHCGKEGWAPSGVTERILAHTKLPLLIVPPH